MLLVLGVTLGILAAGISGEPSPWSSPAQWKHPHAAIAVVDSPHLVPPPPPPSLGHLARRSGPLPGYLHLKPVSSYRNSRWFDAKTNPKQSPPQSRISHDKYPPFWSDNGNSKPRTKRPSPGQFRHSRKDCNPCNSVPWTPIFKSAGLYGNHQARNLVPQVDVYPEASFQQTRVTTPQSLNSQVLLPTVDLSSSQVSLPYGNVPVSPNLLLPPHQPIPFPELSPHPVAPVHDTALFHHESSGLPPALPYKESANVVVTISEPDTTKNVHLTPQDQNADFSSFIDNSLPQNVYHIQNSNLASTINAQNNNRHLASNSGLDIVKSVPLAEYTASIDHPAHIIQAPQYIDVNPQTNRPNTAEFTYEKPPQTGNQKVSDFILGNTQDKTSKKPNIVDNLPAGSEAAPETTALTEEFTAQSNASDEIRKIKLLELKDSYSQLLDSNVLTPPVPPLSPQLTQLLPTYETAFLHPLFPVQTTGVASVVNGALLPPPQPQPMNPSVVSELETDTTKKVQIIIPYTTINNNGFDQNLVADQVRKANQSFFSADNINLWPPIVVTEPTQNLPRQVSNLPTTEENGTVDVHVPSNNGQIRHIFASNIRDLLKKEVEPKQNIRLQKNIDNWTALEYSNHKIVGKKQPSEIISHAHAVTSIPGTSISHLLFPSKKIPDGYFPTSVSPNFDDPPTTQFPFSSVSVNSEPFTTASRYSTVAYRGYSAGTRKRMRSTTPLPLNDNQVQETTNLALRWSDDDVSIAPGSNEKVYVVTPESAPEGAHRSTRHIDTTEKSSYTPSSNALFTKLEKVTNLTESNFGDKKSKTKQKPLYPKSTVLFKIKADPARYEKMSKFPKPKPIDKFFATTSKPLSSLKTSQAASTQEETTISHVQNEANKLVMSLLSSDVSTTSPPLSNVSTDTTFLHEAFTSASFPFRNGGEIPVEMTEVDFSQSQLTFKNSGSRKTLIKQMKTNNHKIKEEVTSTSIVTPVPKFPARNIQNEKLKIKVNNSPTSTMNVEIVLPTKLDVQDQKFEGIPETENKTKAVIKPDEPNITEDDRDEINELMKELALEVDSSNETLLAVETSSPTRPSNSSSVLLNTIKLLREFLAETSEEEISYEKSGQIGKVIDKLNTTDPIKKLSESKYKYNFPEYLTKELQLNKGEMGIVKSAIIELKKTKNDKKKLY